MAKRRMTSGSFSHRKRPRVIATTDDPDIIADSHFLFSPDRDSTTWEDRSDDKLTAPVELPSEESMTVKLWPINQIDRLEEYQSDENWGHTIIGILFGAIIGIFAQWASTDAWEISKTSVFLIICFASFAVLVIAWLWRVKQRAFSIKLRMREFSDD